MFSETVAKKIKELDVYKKVPQNLAEPTLIGAVISIFAAGCMMLLFFTELNRYLTPTTSSEMFVDVNRGSEQLPISFDVTLHKFPCAGVSVDAQDVMGTHIPNISESIVLMRLDQNGQQLPEDISAVSAQKIKEQFDNQEGCRVIGNLSVNKVPGNFHLGTHAYGAWIKQAVPDSNKLDMGHTVNHLRFGDNEDIEKIRQQFVEGVLDPLDNTSREKTGAQQIDFEYYLKVVPTTYEKEDLQISVHQFTSNNHEQFGSTTAIYFRYELSPVTVRYTQTNQSAFTFIVQICAIIGGVFTVVGIIDSLLHASVKALFGKKD